MFFQEYSMQNSRTIRNSSCSLQQSCPLNHGTAPAAYHGVFASIAFNCKLKNYYCNHGTNKGLLWLHDTTWCLFIMRLKLQYISLIICYNTKSYLIEFQSNLIDILKKLLLHASPREDIFYCYVKLFFPKVDVIWTRLPQSCFGIDILL